jgi:hypothetical protein
MNTRTHPDETILQLDKEHGGIQFVVLLVILVGAILSFIVMDSLILAPLLGGGDLDDYRPFLRFVLSIVAGVATGWVVETILKRTWTSGRQLRLDSAGLTVEEPSKPPQRLLWDQRINVLCWAYSLRGISRGGRERRVPSNHFMYACQLLQDEYSATIHCYLSPRQARSIPGESQFTQLDITKLHDSKIRRFSPPQRPNVSASLLTGKNGQLWAAEKLRWSRGLELDPSDFSTLLEWLARHEIIAAA